MPAQSCLTWLFEMQGTLLQEWRQTLWAHIKTDLMEDGTKNFVKEVKALNKKVRDDDCFKVSKSATNTATSSAAVT